MIRMSFQAPSNLSLIHISFSVLERLGRLEDLYDALIAEREKTASQMEELRGQGKVKTVTYQQHIAHKLMLQNLIDRMDIYEGQATGAKK